VYVEKIKKMSIIENKTPYTDVSHHRISPIAKKRLIEYNEKKEQYTSLHISDSCGVLIRYLLSNTEGKHNTTQTKIEKKPKYPT